MLSLHQLTKDGIMNTKQICMLITVWLWVLSAAAQVEVEDGVSQKLAQYRAEHVSNVGYQLTFNIPEQREQSVGFCEVITFSYNGKEALQIDFQGEVASCKVNKRQLKAVDYRDEHIIIPKKYLRKGTNSVEITGSSLDKALNRQHDYLYTLFVPDHARSVFPCFDQPDVKARYMLKLSVPEHWEAISNGACRQQSSANTYQFAETEPLPTYLFSFTAGKFHKQTAVRDGRQMTALYRETDPKKVAQLQIVFDEIALSLRWLEEYTGIPYPFSKYDFAILPGYQFGGMEHPGCIQYRDRTLFLGENPTPDEELSRLQLLAHETSHMWFGDLVTMRWFNDVWTKEVFANFMADKIGREQFPDINHDLSFIKSHYIPALATDRTEGTHPIQQPLDNLKNAGLLYGNIIYHKAPIMMRKLEEQMGDAPFRRGLQQYLRRFSYGNATWDDLIAILDNENPQAGIKEFDRQWVKSKGVNIIDADASDGKPLPNTDGMGYARYRFADSNAVTQYVNRWDELSTEQSRMAAAMILYENYLMHKAPADLTFTGVWMLAASEGNELTLSVCANILSHVMRHLPSNQRQEMEKILWKTMQEHPVRSFRQQLLRTLCTNATTPELVDSIQNIWEQASNPLLTERNYINTAYHLAMMRPARWLEIIAKQRARLKNEDVIREFDFVSRACNPDADVQKQLFESLLKKENRAIEPYAANMLSLLNSSLREPHNNRFITPGLEVLEEVQRTGDIFFPLDWCNALLSGHRSAEARQMVQQFINAHPDYPEPLRNKLLQAAFMLLNGE